MPIEGADTTERPSLADALSTAFDETVGKEAVTEAPVVTTAPAQADSAAGAAAAPRPRDDGRDNLGRYAEKKAEAPADAYTPPKFPSTWRKELEPDWGKLSKAMHEEILRREGNFAGGVSTYKGEYDRVKGEYDRVKPLQDALTPYQEMIQRANMQPHQVVGNLLGLHQTFSGQDRPAAMRAFVKFAQDYQIPLNELFVQGEDGKVYFNQQLMNQQAAQQQAPAMTQEDIDKRVALQLSRMKINEAVQQFVAAKDASGNPQYPHFEKVRATMDGLLRSGLATDLPGAYLAALGFPQHSELREADETLRRETEDKEKQRLAQEAAQRAQRKAVSPRSSIPAEPVDRKERKGLRAALEDAATTHLSGGRV